MSFVRVRVDLDALASNYRLFQAHSKREVGAVVKANGYGLGAVPVATRLQSEGCRSFFVATLDEAMQLRPNVSGVIYVLEPPIGGRGLIATFAEGCVPVVNSHAQLENTRGVENLAVAVHVDTGMERLGIPYRTIDGATLRAVDMRLLLTHLASADDPDDPFNAVQLARFEAVATQVPGIRTSIGNSAGTLNGERFQGDVARPGIGLYGANPFTNKENPTKTVATCEAQVLEIRSVEAGASIGYGQTYVAPKPLRVAVVGFGYADGLPRILSNVGHFAFGDELLPIRGYISMDLTQIDATDCPHLKVGDWVEFFGKTIDCDDVAKTANSFGYEFLTGLGNRVKRLYV